MSRKVPIPFLPVPSADWREGLSLTARLTLGVYLRRWTKGDDVLAVSLTEIEREAGVTRKTAKRARSELVKRGILVAVHAGGGRSGRGIRDTFRLDANAGERLHRMPDEKGGEAPPQEVPNTVEDPPDKGGSSSPDIEKRPQSNGGGAPPRSERVRTWQ